MNASKARGDVQLNHMHTLKNNIHVYICMQSAYLSFVCCNASPLLLTNVAETVTKRANHPYTNTFSFFEHSRYTKQF